jgi:hypothetical protein
MHIKALNMQVVRNAAGEVGAAPAATPAAPIQNIEPVASENAPADYSFLPEAYRSDDGPNIEGFTEHYETSISRLAQLEEQATGAGEGIPENGDGYDLNVPDDIDFGEMTLPDGYKFQMDPDHPVLPELRSWMHENGIKGDSAPALMSMMAKYEASQVSAFHAQSKEQMTALGANAQQRLSTVQRAMETKIPSAQHREALLNSLTTADSVRALEQLLSGQTTTTSQPATGREADLEGLTGFAKLQAARNAG